MPSITFPLECSETLEARSSFYRLCNTFGDERRLTTEIGYVPNETYSFAQLATVVDTLAHPNPPQLPPIPPTSLLAIASYLDAPFVLRFLSKTLTFGNTPSIIDQAISLFGIRHPDLTWLLDFVESRTKLDPDVVTFIYDQSKNPLPLFQEAFKRTVKRSTWGGGVTTHYSVCLFRPCSQYVENFKDLAEHPLTLYVTMPCCGQLAHASCFRPRYKRQRCSICQTPLFYGEIDFANDDFRAATNRRRLWRHAPKYVKLM